MPKLWIDEKLYSVESEVQEYVEQLENKNERLQSTLQHECPDKYPDKCEVCKGANAGVKGNENIVNGVVMCDYCHAADMIRRKDDQSRNHIPKRTITNP